MVVWVSAFQGIFPAVCAPAPSVLTQAEKRRLEKYRNRWMAEQLRRQRELEAKEKAAVRRKGQLSLLEGSSARGSVPWMESKPLPADFCRHLPLGASQHHRSPHPACTQMLTAHAIWPPVPASQRAELELREKEKREMFDAIEQ